MFRRLLSCTTTRSLEQWRETDKLTGKSWGDGAERATSLNLSWMKRQKSNGHREVLRLVGWEKL
jgi:hypothetical protein